MKKKSKISLAKAITLGLLLSTGLGYSTGVSAANDNYAGGVDVHLTSGSLPAVEVDYYSYDTNVRTYGGVGVTFFGDHNYFYSDIGNFDHTTSSCDYYYNFPSLAIHIGNEALVFSGNTYSENILIGDSSSFKIDNVNLEGHGIYGLSTSGSVTQFVSGNDYNVYYNLRFEEHNGTAGHLVIDNSTAGTTQITTGGTLNYAWFSKDSSEDDTVKGASEDAIADLQSVTLIGKSTAATAEGKTIKITSSESDGHAINHISGDVEAKGVAISSVSQNGINDVDGNVTLGGLTGYNSTYGTVAAGTVLQVLTQGSLLKDVMDEYYAGKTDGTYKDYMSLAKSELEDNSVIVVATNGAAVKDVLGTVEVYGVRNADGTYTTQLSGKDGIINVGGNVGVYGSSVTGKVSGISFVGYDSEKKAVNNPADVSVRNSQIKAEEHDAVGFVTGSVDAGYSTIIATNGTGFSNIGDTVDLDHVYITAGVGVREVGGRTTNGLNGQVKITESIINTVAAGVFKVAGTVSITDSVLNVGYFWGAPNYGTEVQCWGGASDKVVSGIALGAITGDVTINGSIINSAKGYAVQYVGYTGLTGDGPTAAEGHTGDVTVEKSSVYGMLGGIDSVNGNVKVRDGSTVSSWFGAAIDSVEGQVVVEDSTLSGQQGITKVTGGVRMDNSTIYANGYGITEVAGVQAKTGNGDMGVTVASNSKIFSKLDAISKVENGVRVGGGSEVISSFGYGINKVGRTNNGDVWVGEGAEVYGFLGGINEVAGDVVVTGEGTKVSSWFGDGISRVNGDVQVVAGSTVNAWNGAGITNVGGKTTVGKSEINAKYGIKDVGGTFDDEGPAVVVRNGATINATNAGVVQVKGDVKISGSTVNVGMDWNPWVGQYYVDPAHEYVSGVALGGITGDLTVENSKITSAKGYAIQYVGYTGVGEDGKLVMSGEISEYTGRVTVKDSEIYAFLGGIDHVTGNLTVADSEIYAGRDGINLFDAKAPVSAPSDASDDVKNEWYVTHQDWVLNTKIVAGRDGISLDYRGSNHQFNLNNVTIDTQATGIKAHNSSVVYLTKKARPELTYYPEWVGFDSEMKATTDKEGNLAITLHENIFKNNTVVGIDANNGSIVDLTHGGEVSIKLNSTTDDSGTVYDTVREMTAVKADGVLVVSETDKRPAEVLFKNLELSDVVATDKAYGFVATNGAEIGGVENDQLTYGTLKKATADKGQGLVVEATGNFGVATALYANDDDAKIMLDMQDGDIDVKANGHSGKAKAVHAIDAEVDLQNVGDVTVNGKVAEGVNLYDHATMKANKIGNVKVDASGSFNGYAQGFVANKDSNIWVGKVGEVKVTSAKDNAKGFYALNGSHITIGEMSDLKVKGGDEAQGVVVDGGSSAYFGKMGDVSVVSKDDLAVGFKSNMGSITVEDMDKLVVVGKTATGLDLDKSFANLQGVDSITAVASDGSNATESQADGEADFADGVTKIHRVWGELTEENIGTLDKTSVGKIYTNGFVYQQCVKDETSGEYKLVNVTLKAGQVYGVDGTLQKMQPGWWGMPMLVGYNPEDYKAVAVDANKSALWLNGGGVAVDAYALVGNAYGIVADQATVIGGVDVVEGEDGDDDDTVTVKAVNTTGVHASSVYANATALDANKSFVSLKGVASDDATEDNVPAITAEADKDAKAIKARKSTVQVEGVATVSAKSEKGNAIALDAKKSSAFLDGVVDINAESTYGNAIAIKTYKTNLTVESGVDSIIVLGTPSGYPNVKPALLGEDSANPVNPVVEAYAGKTAQGIVAEESTLNFDGLTGIVAVASDGLVFDKEHKGAVKVTKGAEGKYYETKEDGTASDKVADLQYGQVYDVDGKLQVWDQKQWGWMKYDTFADYNPEDYKAVGLDLNKATLLVPSIGAAKIEGLPGQDGIIVKDVVNYGITAEATVGNAYGIVAQKSTILAPGTPVINDTQNITEGVDEGSANTLESVPSTPLVMPLVSIPTVFAYARNANAIAMDISEGSYVGLKDVDMVSAYAGKDAVALKVSKGAKVDLVGDEYAAIFATADKSAKAIVAEKGAKVNVNGVKDIVAVSTREVEKTSEYSETKIVNVKNPVWGVTEVTDSVTSFETGKKYYKLVDGVLTVKKVGESVPTKWDDTTWAKTDTITIGANAIRMVGNKWYVLGDDGIVEKTFAEGEDVLYKNAFGDYFTAGTDNPFGEKVNFEEGKAYNIGGVIYVAKAWGKLSKDTSVYDVVAVDAQKGAEVRIADVITISAESGIGDATAIRARKGADVYVNFNGSLLEAKAPNGDAIGISMENGAEVHINDIVDDGKPGLTVDVEGKSAIGVTMNGDNNNVDLDNIQQMNIEATDGAAALAYVNNAAGTDGNTVSLTGVDGDAPVQVVVASPEGQFNNILAVEGDGSAVSLNLENIAVQGQDSEDNERGTDIYAGEGATASINLKKSSFKGAAIVGGTGDGAGKINMSLDANSYWGVTDNSTVNNLTNDGVVDLTADNKGGEDFSTLNVNTLVQTQGNKATFNLDVNMDPDVVTEGDAPTDQVVIGNTNLVDAGGQPVTEGKISLNINPNFVNMDENGDILSILGDGEKTPQMMKLPLAADTAPEDVYDITLGGVENVDFGPIRSNVAPVVGEGGGVSIALEPTKDSNGDQVLSAKGNAAMSAVIDPETWHMDTEALYENISNLRPERERTDVWASYTNKKNTYDDSFDDKVFNNGDIDKRYSGVVLGIDNKAKYYQKANANLFVGVMFSYGDGKYSWADGSNELDGAGVGLYAIYKTAKGSYFGATAKYNRYSFDEIKGTQMGSWKSFNGEYDTDAYGLSLVAGKRIAKDQQKGFYVEPQAELAYVNYGSDKYDLDGMDVEVDSMKSLRARVGLQIGSRNISKKTFSDIYAKVSFLHEFFGDNDVNMGAYTYESDQGGSWVNFALGFSVGSMDKFNANFSANLSRGSHKSKVGFKTVLNFLY